MNRRFRLVAALGVALVLCVFLGYTALAGSSVGVPTIQAYQLASKQAVAQKEDVELVGVAAGPISGSGDTTLRFTVTDAQHENPVAVTYQGSVPDSFQADRHVVLRGRLVHGTFVGQRDSLTTKCPSKYQSDGTTDSSASRAA